MGEPSLGADNLGRERSSSKLWPGPSWLQERDSWGGEHVLQLPAGLEVEHGKGDGNWVTGGSFHWEGGREELGISQQHWESSHAFRVWGRLPGCKYPFPAPKLPQESSLLLQAAGTRGLASLGCCGSVGVSWALQLPARTGTGILLLAHGDHLDIEHQKLEQSGVAPSCLIWAGYEFPHSQHCSLLPPGWI